ncbi:MAG: hypothetical protein HETSPECPRED_008742 [Heterodermia speciosa]|uniref:SnoaL-like domain-containing protein n=1 Tax=Heterodermia speciosa TaxID=116794 RepID=A0A8H3G628_9LECA|nr:MAG: hypothetical protein HETSPECPRED_008742 [Heterodermia speciosa]
MFSLILCGSLLPWASCILLSPRDAITVAAIDQLGSLFSFSLDEKNFAALADVYTANAIIDGGGPNPLRGLPAIQAFYRQTFSNSSLVTEHTVTTVYAYNFTATTAKSKNYADAFYFGKPAQERGGFLFRNQSVVFRERFDNEYVKEKNGAWKISRQTGPKPIVGFCHIIRRIFVLTLFVIIVS